MVFIYLYNICINEFVSCSRLISVNRLCHMITIVLLLYCTATGYGVMDARA